MPHGRNDGQAKRRNDNNDNSDNSYNNYNYYNNYNFKPSLINLIDLMRNHNCNLITFFLTIQLNRSFFEIIDLI